VGLRASEWGETGLGVKIRSLNLFLSDRRVRETGKGRDIHRSWGLPSTYQGLTTITIENLAGNGWAKTEGQLGPNSPTSKPNGARREASKKNAIRIRRGGLFAVLPVFFQIREPGRRHGERPPFCRYVSICREKKKREKGRGQAYSTKIHFLRGTDLGPQRVVTPFTSREPRREREKPVAPDSGHLRATPSSRDRQFENKGRKVEIYYSQNIELPYVRGTQEGEKDVDVEQSSGSLTDISKALTLSKARKIKRGGKTT